MRRCRLAALFQVAFGDLEDLQQNLVWNLHFGSVVRGKPDLPISDVLGGDFVPRAGGWHGFVGIGWMVSGAQCRSHGSVEPLRDAAGPSTSFDALQEIKPAGRVGETPLIPHGFQDQIPCVQSHGMGFACTSDPLLQHRHTVRMQPCCRANHHAVQGLFRSLVGQSIRCRRRRGISSAVLASRPANSCLATGVSSLWRHCKRGSYV